MADIRFDELVLLECEFEMWPSPQAQKSPEEPATPGAELTTEEPQERFDSE
jgi:hypothetical protein